MNVEGVPVDVGAGTADPPVLQAGLELAEEAEEGAKVQVAVQQVTLQQIAVVAMPVGGGTPEVLVVVKLVPLPDLATKDRRPDRRQRAALAETLP